MAADIVEQELTGLWEGFLAEPGAHENDAGVLVLSGSSGRIERARCRNFARSGVTAVSVRWFGGPGQAPGICEVPLETFVAATELLRERGITRVSILGNSKSAEAALLVSTLTDCADAVIAVAPTSVTWANVGPGNDGRHHPYRSSWTWQGLPLPFVPYDGSWTPAEQEGAPVSVLGWYECSLAMFAERLPAAAIRAEMIRAELVLIAGGADRMWPSLRFARELAERRSAAGLESVLVTRPGAGHRAVFPGEMPLPSSAEFDHGGNPEADSALGAAAWPHVMAAVRGV